MNITVFADHFSETPIYNYTYLLGSDFQKLAIARDTFRNLSVPLSYKETIKNLEVNMPQFKCHFSGSRDGASSPWIKLLLEKSQKIVGLKFFNFVNGQYSSLLEDSTVYIGDSRLGTEVKCAQLGKNLPLNEFINIVCEDVNGGPKNVFSSVKEPYKGTDGDYVRFENNKYEEHGVMTICDVEVTANVINEELENEIDEAL